MRARHRDVWRMAAKVAAVIRRRMLAPAKGEGGNEESPQRLGTSGAMWATLIIPLLPGSRGQTNNI